MKIGDIVRLKSGGPKMTVTALAEDQASCTWFDRNGKRHDGAFAVATVEAFVPRPPEPPKKDW